MKFTIGREDLLTSLQQLVGVCEKKTTMPILGNVLLEAKNKKLTLTATDLEVCLVSESEGRVEIEGRHTLPAKSLFDIVKEFPRNDIEFELVENQQVELRSQKTQFRLLGMSAEDFPVFPAVKEGAFGKIPMNVLRDMLEKVSFSISTDEMRYNLNGVLFESANTTAGKPVLRMVSTDGHRLSLVEYPMEPVGAQSNALPFKDKAILPRKGVMELKRLVTDGNDDIEIGYDGNNAVIKLAGSTLYMRKIIGEFPEYGKVIPKAVKRNAIVNRQDFIGALKRMLLMSSSKQKLVRYDFNSEYLEMTCQNPELGTAREEIEIRFDGQTMTVGFNPRYYLDVLGVIDQKEIAVGFVDELSPAIIETTKEINGKESLYQSVIMPMRL